ncbi:MAG: hypothetical protein ACE5HB_07945 [Terriglobia bacterium]
MAANAADATPGTRREAPFDFAQGRLLTMNDLTLGEWLLLAWMILACYVGAIACWTLALLIASLRGWLDKDKWRSRLRAIWAQTRGLWS